MDIAITALIAGLALTVVHLLAVWGNLPRLSKPPMSYIVGVATLGVPYVALLLWRGDRWAAVAFAATVSAGGAPVIVGHVVKKFQMLWKENEILREELKSGRRQR